LPRHASYFSTVLPSLLYNGFYFLSSFIFAQSIAFEQKKTVLVKKSNGSRKSLNNKKQLFLLRHFISVIEIAIKKN
jgi:hypothetical protein